jgi:hypothetical protein
MRMQQDVPPKMGFSGCRKDPLPNNHCSRSFTEASP